MFSHQGTTYYPSAIAPEAPGLNGRNLLKEFEGECRKQNIRLVVYLNSKWVTDLYHQHPDWGVRFKSGPFTFKDVDSATSLMIYPMCPCSPFTDYFKKIIREVVGISSPDGIYIDNFAIIPVCKCRFCLERFGGNIFATYETSLYDRKRKRAKDFMLAGVLGAHFAKKLGPQCEGYCAGYAKFTGCSHLTMPYHSPAFAGFIRQVNMQKLRLYIPEISP